MKTKNIFINLLVVLTAIYIGGWINMFLIETGPKFIAPPAGVDMTTEAGLKAGMQLMQPQHFLFPYLAHAIGTMVAAFIITILARTHHFKLAMIPGFAFLIGGIMMVMMLPSPLWFDTLDLLGAYIPMAFIGYRLGKKIKSQSKPSH